MVRQKLRAGLRSLRRAGAVVAVGALCTPVLTGTAAAGTAALDDEDAVVHPREWQVHPAQGSLYEGWSGHDGVGLGLWVNGDATGHLTTTEPATRLVVEAGSDRCPNRGGGARMLLWVDEVLVADEVVDADKGRYVVPGSWAPGAHSVRAQYANDYFGPGCDVNLKLGRAWMDDESLMQRTMLASSFTRSPASSGASYWTPGPGSQPAQLLWSNGSLTTRFSTPFNEGAYIEVQAASDVCPQAHGLAGPTPGPTGHARYELLIDGVSVAHAEAPASVDGRLAHAQRILLPVELSAGPTEVTVRYVNDYADTTCDRNLRVGTLRLVATL